MLNKEVLGLDIGGPIIDMVNDWTPDFFINDEYLKTPAVQGAFDAIRQLVEKSFGENVFLLSVRRTDSQNKTLTWLDHYDFFNLTGVKRNNVHFCVKRAEKAGICQNLGINIYVDDKLENLSYMTMVNTRILFKPNPEEVSNFSNFLSVVQRVD